MQAIDCVMSIIDSGGTMYSRSGGSPSGSSQGTTRWTFFQWTASMSTIRSLSTGMLPMGSTTTLPPFLEAAPPAPPLPAVLGGRLRRRGAYPGVAGEPGLAVDADAAGAADRRAAGAADGNRGVLAVLGLEDAVEHRALGRQIHAEVFPVSGVAAFRVVAPDFQGVIHV